MPQFTFNSIQEVRDFVKNDLRGLRGPKGGDDGEAINPNTQAPAPLQPPVQQSAIGGAGIAFAPQQQSAPPVAFAPPSAAFPGTANQQPPTVDPVIGGLVQRIIARIDAGIANGQPAEPALNWFRNECTKNGHDAMNATLDQIKQVFLPRLSLPALEGIVKLTGA